MKPSSTAEKKTAKKLQPPSPALLGLSASFNATLFAEKLIAWFEKEGLTYPWRETCDPYAIMVSELMLQQTTIAMVMERDYFTRWLTRFPDVESLASAPESDVLRLWEGLGYYNRARHLQKAARLIVSQHASQFPRTYEEVLALPGVGRYTAGAIMSFAYDQPTALVDGNVARVFARLFDFSDNIDTPASQKQLWHWAEQLLPTKNARAYNAALMELGQRICRTGTPSCLLCPVRAFCSAREPELLPVKNKRRSVIKTEERGLIILSASGHILLEKETGTRRRDFWKFPTATADQTKIFPEVYRANYVITHHRVDLRLYQSSARPKKLSPEQQWFSPADLATLPVAAPHRKALQALLPNKVKKKFFNDKK